jgi:hypothetical protein
MFVRPTIPIRAAGVRDIIDRKPSRWPPWETISSPRYGVIMRPRP